MRQRWQLGRILMNGLTKWTIGIIAPLLVLAVMSAANVWREQGIMERDVAQNATNIAQNAALIKQIQETQTQMQRLQVRSLEDIRDMFQRIEDGMRK